MNQPPRTKIIAEIGSNHLGDMSLAESMIRTAAENGVDIVKFQSWQADKLVRSYPDYEAKCEWYKKTQLTDDQHLVLMGLCKKYNVEFLTTVFDLDRVEFLAKICPQRIKIASPDCASHALLKRVKGKFGEIIVSTGMTEDTEILETAKILAGSNFVFMHCVSLYPAPAEQTCFARMAWLKTLSKDVGFSDHSIGADLAKIAVVLGARYVEKHFTIDRNLPGPDQKISNLPEDFKEIARFRDVYLQSWGRPDRKLTDKEYELRRVYIGKWGNNE